MRKLRNFFEIENIIITLVVTFIVFILSLFIDLFTFKYDHDTVGIVIAKQYVPSSTSTVVTHGPNGQTQVGTISESKKMNLVIMYDGITKEKSVSDSIYYVTKEGDLLKLKVYKTFLYKQTYLKIK